MSSKAPLIVLSTMISRELPEALQRDNSTSNNSSTVSPAGNSATVVQTPPSSIQVQLNTTTLGSSTDEETTSPSNITNTPNPTALTSEETSAIQRPDIVDSPPSPSSTHPPGPSLQDDSSPSPAPIASAPIVGGPTPASAIAPTHISRPKVSLVNTSSASSALTISPQAATASSVSENGDGVKVAMPSSGPSSASLSDSISNGIPTSFSPPFIPGPPTTLPNPMTESQGDTSAHHSHVGPIIGGVVGGLVIFCLLFLYLLRKRRKPQNKRVQSIADWLVGEPDLQSRRHTRVSVGASQYLERQGPLYGEERASKLLLGSEFIAYGAPTLDESRYSGISGHTNGPYPPAMISGGQPQAWQSNNPFFNKLAAPTQRTEGDASDIEGVILEYMENKRARGPGSPTSFTSTVYEGIAPTRHHNYI
ncbi:hypothetical protein M422DRAFT_41479 [Sphaerobolus stellatus SS14]|nr:hypothetical protein M422DRAFT_41479 [Sphaerobolus stellatus SS14]